jgi:tryptophanyl-tRNA synthetase
VANYHAPEEVNVEGSIETLKRFGVTKIRLQKDVFNAQLYFELLNLAKIGDLNRMTQFKSAEEDDRTGQLLTYPVLMAHDVAGFEEVVVGVDQEQHLQYAAKLLRKYNRSGHAIMIPKANIVVGRVKDLREPDKKMSKSSPQGCLFLDDEPDVIRQKIRRATANPEGLVNLHLLYREFVGEEPSERNEEMKNRLAEALILTFKA